MSTGLECALIEVEPGQWMLVLEQGSAPKQSWDWREYADSYGMFPTEEATDRFLSEHFANPGGYSIDEYREGRQSDEVEQRLIAKAKPNREAIQRHPGSLSFGWGGF